MKQQERLVKPASGLWSDAYPDLGTGPISLEDSVCPEFYERERDQVFRKSWLWMGRVEQLPESGSFFTRELAVVGTSVILLRGEDGTVRAFHNMCAHRGNKLLWKDDPSAETKGKARQIRCRFHGWRYALDGSLIAPTRPELLRDFDPSTCRLAEIECDVWEGFIFINLDPDNREPLRSFLGDLAHGLEGFPFDRLTQRYAFRLEIACNWKIFMDGFAEGYHTPYLHAASLRDVEASQSEESNELADALGIQLVGAHRMVSWAGAPARKSSYSTPTECLVEAGATGKWGSVHEGAWPPGINPSRSPIWGVDSFQFFPNFVLVFWATGVYSTHAHWPTGPDSHIFEIAINFPAPRSYKERLGQEMTVTYLHDVVLQDISPLEGMQAMLKSRAIQQFQINDEELLVRHLHKVVRDSVDGQGGRP